MIKDRALGDRLNAVKSGKEIPKPTNDDKQIITGQPISAEQEQFYEVPEYPSFSTMALSSIVTLAEITFMSVFYGFGIETILSKDWSFLGLFGVGLLVNQLVSLVSKLKLFNQ
jgi:hypothetical protein